MSRSLFYLCLAFVCLFLFSCDASLDTKLKIKSDALGYDFNVTIKEMGESEKKPIFYITDGESFLDNNLALLLDSLTSAKVIPPAYYAFVGSIDERSGENVRNNLFFCNETYLSFFEQELIPEVEAEIGKTFNPQGRGLIGISFGGLNAAYFAAKGNAFQNIAILSPITYPCSELNQSIAFSERKVLNLFLSSGKNDAESYLAEIHHMFKTKNYNTRVLNTDGSHDFENWKQQLREVIQFLTQP